MNRRHFIGALAAASLATAASPRKIRKAIMYETIKLDGSVLDKFTAVKAAGFEGLEPMSHMSNAEVIDAFKASGLSPASVCCSTHWKNPVTDPDPAVRKVGLLGLEQALRDAKAYGATSVLFVPGVVNKDVSYADAYKRSQTEIRKALPLAQELGVKSPAKTFGIISCSVLSKLPATLTNSNRPLLAGTSTLGTKSTLAGPTSGFTSLESAFRSYTSRNTA